MKQADRAARFLRPWDFAVFAAVILLAVLLFCFPLFSGNGEALAITTDSGTVIYPLSADRVLTLTENTFTLVVEIKNGSAWVAETTCPEEICRRTGKIHRVGETVLCSRAHVLLEIVGEGGFDAVAG